MKGNLFNVKELPTKESVEDYWENIWGKRLQHNENAIWINELESNYCSQVNQKTYKIDNQILEKAIAKIQNGKAPGPDGIIGYWY